MAFLLSWFSCFQAPEGHSPKKARKERKPIPPEIRAQVWTLYHGKSVTGRCYVCGVRISRDKWHCAHVVADADGGNPTVRNLRPSCQHCNLSMGTLNLYWYIQERKMEGPGKENAEKYLRDHPRARKVRRRRRKDNRG